VAHHSHRRLTEAPRKWVEAIGSCHCDGTKGGGRDPGFEDSHLILLDDAGENPFGDGRINGVAGYHAHVRASLFIASADVENGSEWEGLL
jgi:hypothetical protein